MGAAWAMGFRMTIPWDYFQLLDPEWLRERPLTALLYMHSQPPVLNGLLAAVLAVAEGLGAAPETPAAALFLAVGWAGTMLLFSLARKATGSTALATATVVALVAGPGFHLFGNLFFYPFLVAALLLGVVAAVERQVVAGGAWRYVVVALLALTCMTRTLFHPVWAVAVFAVVVSEGARRDGVAAVRAALVPGIVLLVLLVAWPAKNQLVFSRFASSSWTGLNLQKNTGAALNGEFASYVRRGRVSPAMAERIRELAFTFPRRARPQLIRAAKSDGSRNYNHLVILMTDRDMSRRALRWRLEHPAWWATNAAAQYLMWARPTWVHPYREFVRGPDSRLYRGWAELLRMAFFVDVRPVLERLVPWDGLHRQAWIRDRQVPYTIFGLLLFPILMVGGAFHVGGGLRRRDPMAVALAVAWMTIAWSLLVPCLTFGSEGNRMRFSTLPLFLLLAAPTLQTAWDRLRARAR